MDVSVTSTRDDTLCPNSPARASAEATKGEIHRQGPVEHAPVRLVPKRPHDLRRHMYKDEGKRIAHMVWLPVRRPKATHLSQIMLRGPEGQRVAVADGVLDQIPTHTPAVET